MEPKDILGIERADYRKQIVQTLSGKLKKRGKVDERFTVS
ncbi:hypothetical protein METP3_00784 [Methanosarcinales archaeon]|nr:hypothetical protein METP3_00784 [Methanosarcinales archaeon]